VEHVAVSLVCAALVREVALGVLQSSTMQNWKARAGVTVLHTRSNKSKLVIIAVVVSLAVLGLLIVTDSKTSLQVPLERL
jgi:predicted lysophospholipase L1 biosynthesis ABC-type transport system permease subunit